MRTLLRASLLLAVISMLVGSAWAQIPTVEERMLNSGRNPEYCTWKAEEIRFWPPPKYEKGDPVPVSCYRYDFTLPAKPRQASITLSPTYGNRWWFTVNGQVIAEPLPGRVRGLRNFDLTKVLRPGHNLLTVRAEEFTAGHGFHLVAEGIVFCEDGSIVRLLTDKTWKGDWNLPEGWDKPETDPDSLPPADAFRRGAPVQSNAGLQTNPPYYGRIQIAPRGMDQPIFDEEKPIELDITLLNTASASKPNLSYEIMDEMSRKVIGQGAVALSPKGKLDLVGNVRQQLPAGTYRFRFILTDEGEGIDRRDYEVACVGEIKQRLVEGTHYEEGMELKEIWSVDCAAEPEPGQFLACDSQGNDVKTQVVEGPAGKYRALVENRPLTSFGYKFKVKQLFVPHLVVIEWPDDAARGILAQAHEATTMIGRSWRASVAGFQRGETSVVCTDDQPVRTNKMQKLRFIYWPNEEEESIHIWNTHGCPAPAAVSRITIYQILNDLPALRIADAGDHMIGYHTERGPQTMTASYYAGPLGASFSTMLAGVDHPEFYRNWYTTTENMIKRMRFSGQNAYLMGHFMYTGVLYPSKHYIFAQNTYGGADASRDYIGLVLRMFERNGMSMVSNIEYVSTADVIEASPATIEEVRKGAPTLFCVGKNGTFNTLHGISSWTGLNYFHPKVQESILTIVDELLELYRGYPAWKGMAFILSRNFGPMIPLAGGSKEDPIYWGYEDYTIDLFQKQTGIKIPVNPKDPERFGQRYDWLMADAKQKWIDWRCAQFTQFFRKMRDHIVRARPDLKLYLLNFEPMSPTKSAQDLYGHFDDQKFMKQTVKAFGFDPETLRKERGIVISFSYPSPGTGTTVGAKSRTWWDMLHSQLWNDLFANDGKGGAYVWSSIPHYGYHFPKGKWLFEYSHTRQGYFWPKFMGDAFVNVLVRSNPTWIPHTWMDVMESGGRLHELRLFSRAYRTLPNGKYQRLTGNGLDKNIWVERTRAKGGEYAYAANTNWWEVDVTLTFAQGAKVHDLIKDQPVNLRDGKWSFHLGPYEVRTFRISGASRGGGSSVREATVSLPQEAEAAVDKHVEQAEEVVARAHAKEAEIRDLPGWNSVDDLEQMIAQIGELEAAGDLSRAYQIAASWQLQHAQEQVVNEALEASPFLVLGPFGDPKDTASPPESYYEVVPQYQGMETPYLGEFDGADYDVLVEGLHPDLSKSYPAYPGKQTKWQAAIKSHYLSFYGVCHSEHPLWMVAYAYTEIYSPQDRDAIIWVGSDHAIWVWVNGERVIKHGGHGTHRGGQRPSAADQNRGDCHLQKGWNRVLVKVVQRGLARVFFRITDRDGNPIDDLRFRVPRPE